MATELKLELLITGDMLAPFLKALKSMQRKQVAAGFPQGEDKPRIDANGKPAGINNATIAYVQNFGSPENNIPARPFMVEGIENKRLQIIEALRRAGLATLDGNTQGFDTALHAAGIAAQQGIQAKINDGPFEPLADSTLKARARRGREGAVEELDRRAAGEDPGVESARPLVDTGALRNAVSYAVIAKK